MSCDCPACERPCQRTGRKCFVPCAECMTAVEYDAIGAITSLTWRIQGDRSSPPSIYSDNFWQQLVNAGILKPGEA